MPERAAIRSQCEGGADTHHPVPQRDYDILERVCSVRVTVPSQEENEMLPKAKELDIDFEALGQKMLDRKKELKKDGIPKDAEHSMVARAKGKGDSPAAASRKKALALYKTRENGTAHSAASKRKDSTPVTE